MKGNLEVAAGLLLVLALAACNTVQSPVPADREPEPNDAPPETLRVDTGLDPSDAFAFLRPLGENDRRPRRSGDFDNSLLDVLEVTVCRLTDATCDDEDPARLSSEGKGAGSLALRGAAFYQVRWDPKSQQAEDGETYQISVLAAGLELGSVDYAIDRRSEKRAVMIAFRVEDHPLIRARVLAREGNAQHVAQELQREFDLEPEIAAQLLADEGFAATEVAVALLDVFGEEAEGAAQTLQDVGYQYGSIAKAVGQAFDRSAEDVARIFAETLGRSGDVLAGALLFAGYQADDVVGGLLEVHELTAEQVSAFFTEDFAEEWLEDYAPDWEGQWPSIQAGRLAAALENADFDADEIASAFQEVVQLRFAESAQALEGMFTLAEVTGALAELDGATHERIAEALDSAKYTAEQIAGALSEELDLAVEDVAKALDRAGIGLHDLASALHALDGIDAAGVVYVLVNELEIDYGEVGSVLEDVLGLDDDEILEAIYDGFGLAYAEYADALRELGLPTDQDIIGALEEYYDATTSEIAKALRFAGYGLEEVADFVHDLESGDASAITRALEFAEYAVADMTGELDRLGFDDWTVVGALKSVGVSPDAFAESVKQEFNLSLGGLAFLLRSHYDLEVVAETVDDLVDAVSEVDRVSEVADALAAYTSDEVASALHEYLEASAGHAMVALGGPDAVNDVISALVSADYGADEIASALDEEFDETKSDIISRLDDHFNVEEVARALESAFGLSAEEVGELLDEAGYALAQVGSSLASVYDLTVDELGSVLEDIGYAADELEDLLGDAWDEIEDGFCDLFGC